VTRVRIRSMRRRILQAVIGLAKDASHNCILLAVAKNRITQGSTTVQRHAACAVMWDGQACGLLKLYQRSVTLDVPVSTPGGVCSSRARRLARKSGVDHDRGYRISPQHLLYLPDRGSTLDLLVSLRKLFSPSPRFCTRLRSYDNYLAAIYCKRFVENGELLIWPFLFSKCRLNNEAAVGGSAWGRRACDGGSDEAAVNRSTLGEEELR